MSAKKILLATTLLAGGCSLPSSCERTPEPKRSQQSISKPSQVNGYQTGFKVPGGIDALEGESKKRIEHALNCEGTVFFQSEEGAFRETDLSATESTAFLSDKLQCISGQVRLCTAVALQYEGGTMVNGFTVSGVCLPKGTEGALEGKNLSTKVDLSKRITERTVLE